jgi:sulfite exporter TauE/SafE
MTPLLAAAFLAGVTGAPHCATMCGPLVAAQARGRASTAAWLAGKLATYVLLGAIAGQAASLVGGVAASGPVVAIVAWLALLWFSLRLAGAPLPHASLGGERALLRAFERVPRGRRVLTPFALGALTGLLPCGLVYAALALAIAAPSAPAGAVVMLAFGTSTLPALGLAAWGVRRAPIRTRGARIVMASFVLALGTASLAHRATLGASSMDEPELCHGE